MQQTEMFPESNSATPFCEESNRKVISEKIRVSQNVTKKLKKLLKQLNAMCDKQKEILEICKEK